jgi:hypothetical protein
MLPSAERIAEHARDGGEALREAIDADILENMLTSPVEKPDVMGAGSVMPLGDEDDLPPVVPVPPAPAGKPVRKLGRGKAPQTVALDAEVRADALAAIRGGGVEIEDTATDAEIIAALNTPEE